MTNIKIKILEETNKPKVGFTNLKFNLSGSEINSSVSNTIIRTICSLVGSYAYNPSLFTYGEKDFEVQPIYNTDKLNLRFENIPICYRLDQPKNYITKCIELESKFYNPDIFTKKTDLEILEEEERIKNENIDNLVMNINVMNDTENIMNVTTNSSGINFYYKQKEIEKDIIYHSGYSCLLLDLKPKQEIEASLVSDFNIPLYHDRYRTVGAIGHEKVSDTSFDIYLESHGQISEKQIVKYACQIIKERIKILRDTIIKNIEKNKENRNELIIENESDTFGYVLYTKMLEHKNILSYTHIREHLQQYNIKIEYIVEGKEFSKILEEVSDNLIKIYDEIYKLF